MHFRATRVILVVIVFLCSTLARSAAQTSPSGSALVTQTFSISSPGNSPTLALTGGQSVCTVVVETSTAFNGLALVPQAASDGPSRPQTWVPVTTIGGGLITAPGATMPGSIVTFGLTNFRVAVTAISSGTVTGVIACNTSNGSNGSNAFVTNPPSPGDGLGIPLLTEGGTLIATVASGSTTVIKGAPGRIYGMIVTTLGSVGFACYNNASTASGTIISGFAASSPQFSTSLLQPYASNGITCASAAGGPVVTVLYQ